MCAHSIDVRRGAWPLGVVRVATWRCSEEQATWRADSIGCTQSLKSKTLFTAASRVCRPTLRSSAARQPDRRAPSCVLFSARSVDRVNLSRIAWRPRRRRSAARAAAVVRVPDPGPRPQRRPSASGASKKTSLTTMIPGCWASPAAPHRSGAHQQLSGSEVQPDPLSGRPTRVSSSEMRWSVARHPTRRRRRRGGARTR